MIASNFHLLLALFAVRKFLKSLARHIDFANILRERFSPGEVKDGTNRIKYKITTVEDAIIGATGICGTRWLRWDSVHPQFELKHVMQV